MITSDGYTYKWYSVPSSSDLGERYTVQVRIAPLGAPEGTPYANYICDCPAGQQSRHCWHLAYVKMLRMDMGVVEGGDERERPLQMIRPPAFMRQHLDDNKFLYRSGAARGEGSSTQKGRRDE